MNMEGYLMVSIFISLMKSYFEHLFMFMLGSHISFLIFLLLICGRSSCIMNKNPLLDICMVNIFPQSEFVCFLNDMF